MEKEEERLKALLEQTDDFDERRKIRADLRAIRKKKLDTLNASAEAESAERAARRAERSRARKTEGEVSTYTGPTITEEILSQIDDEETLQTLLNEIPTSQIEDRRKIRSRIREVKRFKSEEEPSSRQTRITGGTNKQYEEPTSSQKRQYEKTASDNSIETKDEEPTSVAIKTTSNEVSNVMTRSDDARSITLETKHEEDDEPSKDRPTVSSKNVDDGIVNEPDDKLAYDASNEMDNNDEVDDQPFDISGTTVNERYGSTENAEALSIKTTNPMSVDNDEVRFKLTVQQSSNEDSVDQSDELSIDHPVEVQSMEPIGTPVKVNIGQDANDGCNDVKSTNIEKHVSDSVEIENEETERREVNGEKDEGESRRVGEGISLEFKIDSEKPIQEDTTDGGIILKDKESESSTSNKSNEGKSSKSRRPPQNDEKKKPGKVNQVDFRNNLKKSGKIVQGKGPVHLEKKNTTTGAQVDFRSNIKKSGRIGGGGSAVNLETKISTQGAQVDFRSGSLKPSGKLGSTVVNLERKTNTTGAQVDFRTALKKSGGPSPSVESPAENERKGNLKSETRKASLKSDEAPPAACTQAEQPPDTPKVVSSGENDESQGHIKVNIPAPIETKELANESQPSPDETEILSRNGSETAQNRQAIAKNDGKTTPNDTTAGLTDSKTAPAPPTETSKPQNGESEEIPVNIKLDAKVDDMVCISAPSADQKVADSTNKETSETKRKTESKYKPRDSYKRREETAKIGGKKTLFDKMSKFQPKDETTVTPKRYTPRSNLKKDPAPAADKAVNGITVDVEKTSLTVKEPETPVQIEVTDHCEDDGKTRTEVHEEKTTKQDESGVEEKTEVTTTTKTTSPEGGKLTTTETKTTTRRTFMDPELQKRMAQRQRERMAAKREQASSAKNKRMAFMQKLEANSPTQQGPSNVKRSGSNVDKLLSWCRYKLRGYEGLNLTNFSSSWADGLAFCALIHLYLPEKIPYKELLAAGDKKRNFEVAFSAATEAGIPELLEVEDMMSVSNPEPKSVMTYVSSIYKHFNPS